MWEGVYPLPLVGLLSQSPLPLPLEINEQTSMYDALSGEGSCPPACPHPQPATDYHIGKADQLSKLVHIC